MDVPRSANQQDVRRLVPSEFQDDLVHALPILSRNLSIKGRWLLQFKSIDSCRTFLAKYTPTGKSKQIRVARVKHEKAHSWYQPGNHYIVVHASTSSDRSLLERLFTRLSMILGKSGVPSESIAYAMDGQYNAATVEKAKGRWLTAQDLPSSVTTMVLNLESEADAYHVVASLHGISLNSAKTLQETGEAKKSMYVRAWKLP
jgi:hypothetical protein